MKVGERVARVKGLRVEVGAEARRLRVVDGVSLEVGEGETVALVGESGSGKSVTALALTRLLPETTFRQEADLLEVAGHEVMALSARGLRGLRGREVAYVFQDPAGTLNPVIRVGDQVAEAIRLHQPKVNAKVESVNWLGRVGLPNPEGVARRYPHELSGGMQQRVVVAMALACGPKLLIADEPTTALDVTVQAQVLRLLGELRRELNLSVLLITHNLGLVAGMADRVLVMYAGRIVEAGPTRDLLTRPWHPYTQALLRAVPRVSGPKSALEGIPGSIPHPSRLPPGCRFHPRCPVARVACKVEDPELRELGGGRQVACPYAEAGG
ncbi:MAG TPA: ABC transporter ATP-binding protein [Kiritimatiellia bacterium]|nr:ABC transporter ATP-binding protein [Kiritimatiellia bacterium]